MTDSSKDENVSPSAGLGEQLLRYEEEDDAGNPTGRSITFAGIEFQPLQYEHLIDKVLTQEVDIPLNWENARVIESTITEIAVNQYASCTATVECRYSSRTIGLVRGGWLPSGVALREEMVILPDRCTISELGRKFHKGEKRKTEDHDFLDLFAERRVRINPLLFALESNLAELPTPKTVEQQLEEATRKIKTALPMAEVVPDGKSGLPGVLGLIQDSKSSMERKQDLLMSLAPTLHAPVSSKRKLLLWDHILATADKFNVPRRSLVVLAALSSIMVSNGRSPAKRLLKLTHSYSNRDAYNALADLRSLEILAGLFALFPKERIMLCTGDKNMALFWVGIRASGFNWTNGAVNFKLSPVEALLPGLTTEQKASYFDD